MKQMMIAGLALAMTLAFSGCKKAEAPAGHMDDGSGMAAPHNPDGNGMAGPGKERGEGMPPELAKFHDIIKPLWHADPGVQRTANTCAAIPALQAQADAVAKATPPPKADAAKWAAATKELVDASAALKDPCDKNDAVAFEPAFKRVHEGFHGLLAASGADEGEHEQHEHEHGHHE